MPPALTNVKAGRLRALAVTTPKRNAAAPDVPTVSEAGLKGFDIVLYSGVLGPARLPAPIVNKLNAELVKAVSAADMRERFAGVGVEPQSKTSEQMAAYLKSEIDKYGKIVRAIGLKID